MSFPLKKVLSIAGLALWVLAVGCGMFWLADYSFTPGRAGQAAPAWPADATPENGKDRFTLVVALHPECPCSRATLRQLDTVLLNAAGRMRVLAVFADQLPDSPAEASDLYAQARALPDVRLVSDRDGSWMRRFDFHTSGEIRLYRPDGTLAFQGGITAGRGHEGDNPGSDAVIAAVRATSPATGLAQAPVFGCALDNS